MAIAAADSSATHYGCTLLTIPDPGAAGVVTTIRVVDGQQGLTTVSILLASIAAELGSVGDCNGWTRQIILDDRLTNPGKPTEKRRKLRDGDEDEFRLGLEGVPVGAGAVTQAWRIARRLVTRNDVGLLLKGLDRLPVVSIGLDDKEDSAECPVECLTTANDFREKNRLQHVFSFLKPTALILRLSLVCVSGFNLIPEPRIPFQCWPDQAMRGNLEPIAILIFPDSS